LLGCELADYTVAVAGQDTDGCTSEAVFVVSHSLS
jgi:hypothetical protein